MSYSVHFFSNWQTTATSAPCSRARYHRVCCCSFKSNRNNGILSSEETWQKDLNLLVCTIEWWLSERRFHLSTKDKLVFEFAKHSKKWIAAATAGRLNTLWIFCTKFHSLASYCRIFLQEPSSLIEIVTGFKNSRVYITGLLGIGVRVGIMYPREICTPAMGTAVWSNFELHSKQCQQTGSYHFLNTRKWVQMLIFESIHLFFFAHYHYHNTGTFGYRAKLGYWVCSILSTRYVFALNIIDKCMLISFSTTHRLNILSCHRCFWCQ